MHGPRLKQKLFVLPTVFEPVISASLSPFTKASCIQSRRGACVALIAADELASV